MAAYTLVNEAARRQISVDALIRQTVAKHDGNVRRASIELDVSTEAIYRILRKRSAARPVSPAVGSK